MSDQTKPTQKIEGQHAFDAQSLWRTRLVEMMRRDPIERVRMIATYILAAQQLAAEMKRATALTMPEHSSKEFDAYLEHMETELGRHGVEMLGFNPWQILDPSPTLPPEGPQQTEGNHGSVDHDKIQYREPTEDDLENGPIACEVRDFYGDRWRKGTLVRITNPTRHFVIISQFDDRFFRDCRIKVTSPESPTLPPEDPHLARSNLGCFIKTYFPKAEFGMDIAAFAARTRADRNNHFLDSTSLAELVLKKDPSPTLPPEGPEQGDKNATSN